MTWPKDFQHANQDFDALLLAVMDEADLATRNQAWTTLQAVLQAFRKHLSLEQAISFANALPPLTRALFITDWNTGETPAPFGTREQMTEDVKNLRRDHNFSRDTAICDVAKALRKSVDAKAFDAVLAKLPEGAVDFWSV